MPKLPVVSSGKAIHAASKFGYKATRQSGSHIIPKEEGGKLFVIPNHKKPKKGTLLQNYCFGIILAV